MTQLEKMDLQLSRIIDRYLKTIQKNNDESKDHISK